MNDSVSNDQLATCPIGPLYGVLYWTIKNRFLGFSIAGWLKNASFFLAVIALLFSWGFGAVILFIGLTVVLRILYWKANKDGYIRFKPFSITEASASGELIGADKKVKLNATGKFSVKNLEAYVVRQQAEYWRVPMGDHAVMVKQGKNRFLYQFIKNELVESVVAGILCHGRQPESALEITFQSTWGPEAEDANFMFYAPSKSSEPKTLRRKLYLGFNDRNLLHDVWHSLIIDGRLSNDE